MTIFTMSVADTNSLDSTVFSRSFIGVLVEPAALSVDFSRAYNTYKMSIFSSKGQKFTSMCTLLIINNCISLLFHKHYKKL